MKLFSSVLLLIAICCQGIFAQSFLSPVDTYSHKKPAYITLEDGTELEGTLSDVDRKKGLLEEIKLKVDGKKKKYDGEDIATLYLPASGYDKLASKMDYAQDIQKWDNDELRADVINKGYAYLEKSKIKKGKKVHTLHVMLVNPSFSGKLKVYHDPLAKESIAVGVGGFTLAGGLEKSYYVKKDEIAIRVEKKNYKDEFETLYGDCPAVMKKYPGKKWSDFTMHVFDHSQCE